MRMKKVEQYVEGALRLRKINDELAYDHAADRLESVWYSLDTDEQDLAAKLVHIAIEDEKE